MRIIDADKVRQKLNSDDWGTPDERWRPEREFGELIDQAPTVDLWHYPSKGEYPPLLEYVFCKLTDDTYEVGYYQGQIDGEPEWAFTCFLGDVVAWQYIVPPKEEA